MMMFIGAAVVHENRKKIPYWDCCWEQFRNKMEWDTALHNYSSGFHKSFPYANTFMAQVKHRKKCKRTHTNKMKFIVKNKKFEVSKLFQTILMECAFFLFSHTQHSIVASLLWIILFCTYEFNFFPLTPSVCPFLYNNASKINLSTGDESLISTSMQSVIPTSTDLQS